MWISYLLTDMKAVWTLHIYNNASTSRSLDNIRSRSDCIASSVMEHGIETDAVVDRTAGDTAAEIDAVRQTYQVSSFRRFLLSHHYILYSNTF